jgi:putative membrane-bound dehydrogenase-like protein
MRILRTPLSSLSRALRLPTLLAVAVCIALGRAGAGDVPQATDAPKPLEPEQSRQRFRLPDGFRIELVAAEPQLREPTGVCFDARGRMYVCEIHGYNLDGYYDVLDLNKTGVLDAQVRRIPASKDAERRAAQETYGTVRLLEDTDGDGRMDRSTVFADHLPPCYGAIPARDGVIVLCAPDIVYLADTKGTGHADVRETLFTGFGVGEIWTRISNPRWGLDNWIYAAAGATSGGTIRGPHLKESVKLGNTCFRFKPDGTRLEPVSGGTSGFGLALDDWDDRFLVTNQQHALYVAPLPYHDLARNPYTPSVNPVVNISTYGHPAPLFRTSPPDPWRRKRGEQPEWVKFYGASETRLDLFTSACAPCIYHADLFPDAYRGNHFSCEPAQNLIHRCLLEPEGAGYRVKRAVEGKEFLTSTDPWFRPVNLVVGPEGALYVVDMYREIIEDYSAIPRYLQQQYVQSLVNGRDRGRVWRILTDAPAPRKPNLAAASAAELVAELGSPNDWRRRTAQRLLVERGDRGVVPAVRDMVGRGKTPQARLHALYTLDGLGALKPDLVARALGDEHFALRVHALKRAERWLAHDSELLDRALALADDPSAKVRLQLAFTLGESPDPKALEALARLAERDGDDAWMRAAILSAVPTRAGRLADLLLHRHSEKGAGERLLGPLAAVVGARAEPDEVAALLATISALRGDQAKLLTGLAEGLGHNRPRRVLPAEGQQALERLLASPSAEVRKQVLRVASVFPSGDSGVVRAARQAAMRTALAADLPLAERLAALDLLNGAPPADLKRLRELLNPREPVDVQVAAVRVLASAPGSEIVPSLLADWQQYSPRVQTAVLDAVCARQDRLPLLLDAIDKKQVDPTSLPSIRQAQLLENPDQHIRDRAKKLLAGRTSSEERQQVLARYRNCLTLKRDVKHGRQVFEQQCLKCHQVNGRGTAVGPDLAAVQDRPDESILVDVLDPSSTIVAGYRAYTVITRDGRVATGVLAAETATSVTLRQENAKEDVILRRDIEEMTASSKSLMPEGMEKLLGPQDMADLLGYLREALRPSADKATLFDGDRALVKALNEGEGTASLAAEEPFAGKASLRVTPSQRFAARIPGWSYRIVEEPGPGEYRYLRLAWKTPAGAGVMVELADKGAWPPADSARGRLYSGANATAWKALPVAKEPPRDWAVVTVDLWKEFGPMTLTGLAPTAMGGEAYFARIELLRAVEEDRPPGR